MPDRLTVYSKPSCVQCDATIRALNKTGIEYDIVDLTQDREAYDMVKSRGFMQAPVVITPQDDAWSGYQPDKIREYADATASSESPNIEPPDSGMALQAEEDIGPSPASTSEGASVA